MTQLDRARSGHLVRPRRRHDVPQDLQFADSILIMGSNMAECHPGGLPLGDPGQDASGRTPAPSSTPTRGFTRTSAMADIYAPLRAGRRHRLLGGLIKYVLERHAAMLAHEGPRPPDVDRPRAVLPRLPDALHQRPDADQRGLQGHRGPRRAVLRLRPEGGEKYNQKRWRYAGEPADDPQRRRAANPARASRTRSAGRSANWSGRRRRRTRRWRRPTASSRSCCATTARYTPEMVEQACGTPRDVFGAWRGRFTRTPGRSRTGAICYAVGWTQHTDRRADNPRRRRPATAARQHRPARRRHPGAAGPARPSRARPTSRRCTTCCRATSTPQRLAEARYAVRLHRHGDVRDLVVEHTGVPHQPAHTHGSAGTTRRRRTVTPTVICRGWSAITPHADVRRDVEGPDLDGLLRHGPEPGRRRAEHLVPAAGPGAVEVARSSVTCTRPRLPAFWKDSPRSRTGNCGRRTSRPRSSSSPPPPWPRVTAVSPTRSGCCVRAGLAWSTARSRLTSNRRSRRCSETGSYGQRSNPARQRFPRPWAPRYRDDADGDRFPFVFTTYRLTEHHTAGGMTRTLVPSGRIAAGLVLRSHAAVGGRTRP